MPPTRTANSFAAARTKSPHLSPAHRRPPSSAGTKALPPTAAAPSATHNTKEVIGIESVRIASGDDIQGLALSSAGSDHDSLPNSLAFIGRRSSNDEHSPHQQQNPPNLFPNPPNLFAHYYRNSSLNTALGSQAHQNLQQQHHQQQQYQQHLQASGASGLLGYTSPSFHSGGLSPAESFSATSDSSPAGSIQPLPPLDSSEHTSQQQLQQEQQHRQQQSFVSPAEMIAAYQGSSSHGLYSVPYGTVQLATQEQQKMFGAAAAAAEGGALGLQGVSGPEDEGEEEEEGDEMGEEEEDDSQDEDDEQGKGKGKAGPSKAKRPQSASSASKLKVKVKGDQDAKTGRRKINICFIEDDARRHITFSKRKAGIMKKAYELATLTGTQVLLLVVSSTGLVYTFSTPKLKPIVRDQEGRDLIQACLNAPDPPTSGASTASSLPPENTTAAHKRAASSSQILQQSKAEYMQSSRTPTLDSKVPSPDNSKLSSPKDRTKRRRTTSSAPDKAPGMAMSASASKGGQGSRSMSRKGSAHDDVPRRSSLQQPPVSAVFSNPEHNESLMAGFTRMHQPHEPHAHHMAHQNHAAHQMINMNPAGISGLPHSPMIVPNDEQHLATAAHWMTASGMAPDGSGHHFFQPVKGQHQPQQFWQAEPGVSDLPGHDIDPSDQQLWQR